jgi:hypothetical protein
MQEVKSQSVPKVCADDRRLLVRCIDLALGVAPIVRIPEEDHARLVELRRLLSEGEQEHLPLPSPPDLR